jgi:hypothetical protein
VPRGSPSFLRITAAFSVKRMYETVGTDADSFEVAQRRPP